MECVVNDAFLHPVPARAAVSINVAIRALSRRPTGRDVSMDASSVRAWSRVISGDWPSTA